MATELNIGGRDLVDHPDIKAQIYSRTLTLLVMARDVPYSDIICFNTAHWEKSHSAFQVKIGGRRYSFEARPYEFHSSVRWGLFEDNKLSFDHIYFGDDEQKEVFTIMKETENLLRARFEAGRKAENDAHYEKERIKKQKQLKKMLKYY